MKKLSISLLVMLLIASLFTSCSMGSDDASDVRVKVKITPSGGGRSLNTDIETINLDDDSITWHYSATKVSETQFNYGATSKSLLPKDGIVTLSQGEWTIGLWGEKDGKKVYAGTIDKTIKWNFYEPNVTVPVPVKQSTGDNGYIVLTDVKIKVGESIITPNYASIDGIAITNLNGAYTKIECAPGNHYVTFAYKEGTSLFGKETITVEVKSGLETKVIGFIDGTGSSGSGESQTTVMQPIEVKKEAEVKIESSITPVTTSSPETKTTVTFPVGSFNDDSSKAVLNLSVKSVGSEFSLTSTGPSTPVAGINISLLVNGNEVKEFNGKEVVIETYIAKDLTDVKVQYIAENTTEDFDIFNSNNDPGASATIPDGYKGIYYKDTGKLIFKTPHFSEYYVLDDKVEAYNATTKKAYESFIAAINELATNDVLYLIKNVEYRNATDLIATDNSTPTGTGPVIKVACTIDGMGHEIKNTISGLVDNSRLLSIFDISSGTVEIKNLKLVSDTYSTWFRGISLANTHDMTIKLDNVTIDIPNYYAFNIAPNCTDTTIEIDKTTIRGWAAINAYGTGNKITVNNSTLEGINSQGLSDWNNFTTVCLEGDTTGHSTLGSSDYEVIINNSTIIAKQTTGNRQSAIGFNSNSKNNSVSLNNTTITLGDEEKCYFAYDNGTGNKIYINDDLGWESPEANCWYSNGPFNTNKTGGMITNLASPFNGGWMADGEGIILEKDIVLTKNITCQMTSGSFYFYLDNHTLTGGSIIINEDVSVISDTANLCIFKSATEGMEITSTNNHDGTYTYHVNSSV